MITIRQWGLPTDHYDCFPDSAGTVPLLSDEKYVLVTRLESRQWKPAHSQAGEQLERSNKLLGSWNSKRTKDASDIRSLFIFLEADVRQSTEKCIVAF